MVGIPACIAGGIDEVLRGKLARVQLAAYEHKLGLLEGNRPADFNRGEPRLGNLVGNVAPRNLAQKAQCLTLVPLAEKCAGETLFCIDELLGVALRTNVNAHHVLAPHNAHGAPARGHGVAMPGIGAGGDEHPLPPDFRERVEHQLLRCDFFESHSNLLTCEFVHDSANREIVFLQYCNRRQTFSSKRLTRVCR